MLAVWKYFRYIKAMFRMWIKQWKNNRLLKDMVYETDEETNRTAKILNGIWLSRYGWIQT